MNVLVKPIYFLDIETGGLDPRLHEIIEIAIVDQSGTILLDSKIVPTRPEDIDPRAAKVNGYTPEKWRGAPSWETVAPEVIDLLDGSKMILAGQNTAFDIGFVRSALQDYKLDTSRLPYWHLDLKTLVFAAVDCGVLPHPDSASLSLGPVLASLGIVNEAPHTALGDARATARAWAVLTERIRLAGAEAAREAIRAIGGTPD